MDMIFIVFILKLSFLPFLQVETTAEVMHSAVVLIAAERDLPST